MRERKTKDFPLTNKDPLQIRREKKRKKIEEEDGGKK
jgi:hypothetical protein